MTKTKSAKINLASPDLEIDSQLTENDIKFITLFRQCAPKEQAYFLSEISLSATAHRRAIANDLARAHAAEMEARP